MNDYDEWAYQNPDEPKNNFCEFCGQPCENKYCSKVCKKECEQIQE